ncbi:glycosyltransferase family 11 [Leptospira fluminis]|uniref:Glycosyltransferase family 11 n=1 Tax=Leptospira fluminis TaxID=2484979 RepID=A0A4R9GM52_9LEPT|nr:glycosyltransferase family 11 [Leptospira fluminis]TGK17294.1 glycosyltransferase family 11 [Leptospira fluminis]
MRSNGLIKFLTACLSLPAATLFYVRLVFLSRALGKKILIYASPYGQLGNRLILFLHFIQYCDKKDVIFLFPAFSEYSDHFASFRDGLVPGYPKLPSSSLFDSSNWKKYSFYIRVLAAIQSRLRCIPGFCVNHLPFFEYSDSTNNESAVSNYSDKIEFLDSEKFEAKIRGKRIIALFGWRFRMKNFVIDPEAKRSILEYLAPNSETISKSDRLLFSYRESFDRIVAVHHRRKDYRIWLNGKFYFESELIRKRMNELRSELNSQGFRKILFLIFSDEKGEDYSVPGASVLLAQGSMVEDLYCMSRCDLILGPPSTFSGWASYSGEVPILHLYSAEDPVRLNLFRKIEVWNGVEIPLVSGEKFIL